jgi:hypothetical protein
MGCFWAQNVDRPRGGHLSRRPTTWHLLRLATPHPSPHGNKSLAVILQTSLAASLLHAQDAHLHGRFHGDGKDASTVPSTPQQ